MRSFAITGAIAGLMTFATPVHAQFARQEYHAIPSEDVTQQQVLKGEKGKPVILSGSLRLPKLGEKLPVIVLFHGGAGVDGSMGANEGWTNVLNQAGYATFSVDGYAARGIWSIADAGKVSAHARVVDAFRALDVLAKHPSVDVSRVALMGFSHGSIAAINANLERFQKAYGTPGLQYAAFISMYGFCITKHQQEDSVTKPILFMHGAADDWVPHDMCREQAARLVKAGKDVRFISYPGATHGFDVPRLMPAVKIAQAASFNACSLEEVEGGNIVSIATKQPFTLQDPCLKPGVNVEYNEVATKKAYEDAKAFLAEVLAKK